MPPTKIPRRTCDPSRPTRSPARTPNTNPNTSRRLLADPVHWLGRASSMGLCHAFFGAPSPATRLDPADSVRSPDWCSRPVRCARYASGPDLRERTDWSSTHRLVICAGDI
jgi:hypothetical protein